jgi:DNA-binding CsgD family transcriptional regulator
MVWLEHGDLTATLDFVATIIDARDVVTLADRVACGLRPLIPCDVSSYTEVRPHRVVSRTDPGDCLFSGAEDVLARLQHENPLIAHAKASGDGSAHRISDFLNSREWQRRELCRTLYEPLDAAGDQMALSLASANGLIGVTVNRKRGTFSDRDRDVLNLIRPHIFAAYRNAVALTRLRARVNALQSALDRTREGIVLLTRQGRVEAMSRGAAERLRRCFGEPPWGDDLPGPLAAWARERRDRISPTSAAARFELPAGRLIVQYVRGGEEGPDFLQVEDDRSGHGAGDGDGRLGASALTRRESEVLRHVAQGDSNRQIAEVLGITPRTVKKHLESVFRKLDVHTRAAAVARAYEGRGGAVP